MAKSTRVDVDPMVELERQRERTLDSAAVFFSDRHDQKKTTWESILEHPNRVDLSNRLSRFVRAASNIVPTIRWWLNFRVQKVYDRNEWLAKLDTRFRTNTLSFFQAAAKAYTDMSWARVALLTIFLMAVIGTADSLIGRPVSFRLIYMLPIWVATRLGGGGSGFIATLIVGLFSTIGDTPFVQSREESQVLNFAIRWISLGGFLFIVLHVEEALKLARQRATRDALTGLANRYTIETHAEEAIASTANRPTPIHLAVIDCDRFKELNDTNGHAFGDHALKMLGKRLETETHGIGSVARLGGDEFIVLFQGVDAGRAEAALAAADLGFQRMLATMSSSGGMSFGLATHGMDGDTFSRLYRIADERMYTTKREKGKAAVCVEVAAVELRDAS